MENLLNRFILDTNILIYLFNNKLAGPLPEGLHYCSVITELELLSFRGLTEHEEGLIRTMFSEMEIYDLNSDIKQITILLRRKYSLKLPDAIIAATSIVARATLITNDQSLQGISELQSISVEVR